MPLLLSQRDGVPRVQSSSQVLHKSSRASELLMAILFLAAFLSMQALTGGTRPLLAFPGYAVLATAGILAALLLWSAKTFPDRLCLCSALLFFGYVLVRALCSPVPYLARSDIYPVLAGLIVYLITSCLLTSAKARLWVFAGLLMAAMVQVGVGAVQFRSGNNFMPIPFLQRFDYGSRASGFYTCPNHLAGLLEALGIFGLSMTFWSRWPVWSKLLTGYAAGICYVGIILTGSRGGYLSATAGLLAFGLLSLNLLRAGGSRLLVRIGAPALIAGALALTVISSLIHQSEFLSDRTRKIADNTDIRLDFWNAAIQQWKLSPLLGTGSRTYLYYGRKYRTQEVQFDANYVHNDYLQLVSEYGLVGAAIFLPFLVAHLRRGWVSAGWLGRRRIAASQNLTSNSMALNLGALACVAGYIVHSVFDFNLHIPANTMLLAFVFGILANSQRSQDRRGYSSAENPLLHKVLLFALAAMLGLQTWRFAPGEYYTERARLNLRDSRPIPAISYALRGLECEKQNPALYYYLGKARVLAADQQDNGDERDSFYRAALPAFAHAREIAPLDETYALELASTYDALQRFAEAEWIYSQATAFDPKSVAAKRDHELHLAKWKTSESFPSSAPAAAPSTRPDS
jgi:O-antigen ligase